MKSPEHSDLTPDNIVAFLGDIFGRHGSSSYLGEQITTSEHMLQGALLAEEDNAPDALIAGILLHDIGHYTHEFPRAAFDQGIDDCHDKAGAAVLAPFFPTMVTACVGSHVAAKRYLCATESDYFDRLSPASVHTLRLQGGPMSETEITVFGNNPELECLLQIRIWDEAAKVAGKKTRSFAYYVPLLESLVDAKLRI
jgi:predicted HD phosphohydrolase